ncbi:hypothetical protein G7Y89_g9138 [Cudoniella acicularis]|uniref:Uncharacterized protein n=1 Tax=Cudoniella acicularis TaxID=354080 RepID=A0A8H4RF79_9HELO|nr:hypothetical protein G7Y89_g9138 [Cudoniella acicularis]
MSASLAPECNETLRFVLPEVQSALKERGIDKMLEEAREDHKENDALNMRRKSGYITARWDLVTRLYELAVFAWNHGVVARTAKGFAILSIFFFLFIIPVERLASRETDLARSVENALKVGTLFRNCSHPISRIYELCELSSMHVLGLANSPQTEVELLQIHAIIGPQLKLPQISCARASTVQIIMFERPLPTRMQYISLNPISLALGDKAEMAIHAPGSVDAEEEREEMKNRERTKKLVEKLKLHTVTKHYPSQKEEALQRIVNQVNCSWELHRLLQKNISLVGRRSRRSLSVSERVVESATSMRDFVLVAIWQIITLYIYPVIRRGFVAGLLCHRVAAEALLLVLEWRAKPEYAALKDISATAQQVEIRLQQFCYWPMQYVTLRKRKDDWESVTTSHPDYIRFYNSLWLVANDVIIGIALGSYIIDNSAWVAESISEILSLYSIAALQRTISWLMDWPAGLKLNNELATFLGDLFLWVIDHWSSGIRFELRDTQQLALTHPDSPPPPPTSYIYLKSVPLTFRAMFHQYFQLGHRIRKHYLSPRVLLCLATGKFVPPIHRKNLYSLQYSMLPAHRAGIMDMWHVLTSNSKEKKAGFEGKIYNGRRVNGGMNGRRYQGY